MAVWSISLVSCNRQSSIVNQKLTRRILILLLLAIALPARGQTVAEGRPFFDAVAFAGTSPDSGRVDLYLAIPYTAVTFERKDAAFAARYQARVYVRQEGRTLFDTSFTRSIVTPTYEATIGRAPAYEFYQHRLMLPTGTYETGVELLDLQKSIVATEQRTVTAVDYKEKPFGLSSLMLVRKIREDSVGHVITPMLTETIGTDDDGYFLFFEAYNRTNHENFRIQAIYNNGTSRIEGEQVFERTIPRGRSQQWVRMPTAQMPRGFFTVELHVKAANDTMHTLATAGRTIRSEGRTAGVPLAEEDLNERIEHLRYAATQRDIDFIRSAPSLLERQHRYSEFWTKFDPTPDTPENEAMDEYFRRIEYADAHFRSYAAGWLTDKGRIYVIYGPPDNVTTDPFRTDGRAVESWQYYRRSVRLVFIDESGFGDFRLSTPISPGEKYRYGA